MVSSGESTSSTPYERHTIVCTDASGKVRPDKFLVELFPALNRTQIQKALGEGKVQVNGLTVSKKQQFFTGDVVELCLESERSLIPVAVDIPLAVVYEDDAIIVINKPAGMVTHPGNGTDDSTLTHALLHHCSGKLSTLNGEDRPGIVHRLDKDTTGLIVAAKSDAALLKLIVDFKERDLDKRYLALCCGTPHTRSGTCSGAIGRHPTYRTRMAVTESGKPARTDWHIRASGDGICLLECKIHTGRTHQIRVHLSQLGYPIIGDTMYEYRANRHPRISLRSDRPLLHAWKLEFQHPITGKTLSFEAPPPADFEPWLERMEAV